MTALPPITLVRQFDTHRLIPSRHLPRGESVLAALADDDEHLKALVDLDAATNDRLLAEQQWLPGIGLEELVFGVPHAQVINASFCHANPLGSRFSGPDRGAWYAGFEVATSQAEVGFHKSVQLAEIGCFEESVTYDDYLADFSASFHDLRRAQRRMPTSIPGATSSLRRWPNGCSRAVHSAWYTRASGVQAVPASPASGPRSSQTFGATAPTALRGKGNPSRSSRWRARPGPADAYLEAAPPAC